MSIVDYNDPLVRKGWLKQGMLQAKSKSFWAPYKAVQGSGQEVNAVVGVAFDDTATKEGHTVIFDYDGNLVNAPIRGKDTAYGKGEKKKKFRSAIKVERYRYVVYNGDKFDAVEIDSLDLTEHEDSRSKLMDLWTRSSDQMINDAVQSLQADAPSHVINTDTTISYDDLVDIETVVKTGTGFTSGGNRRPLTPYRLENGDGVWLFMIDTYTANKMRKDADFKSILSNADVRGADNMLIKGVIARIGALIIVEQSMFFGSTAGVANDAEGGFRIEGSAVEISGFRRRDAAGLWTGQDGYVYTGAQVSRNVVLGNNAVQQAFGKQPDYKYQESSDFGIDSESAMEVWVACQKTIIEATLTGDYDQATVANMDHGIITVETITS